MSHMGPMMCGNRTKFARETTRYEYSSLAQGDGRFFPIEPVVPPITFTEIEANHVRDERSINGPALRIQPGGPHDKFTSGTRKSHTIASTHKR